jgi:hypothetical protein
MIRAAFADERDTANVTKFCCFESHKYSDVVNPACAFASAGKREERI